MHTCTLRYPSPESHAHMHSESTLARIHNSGDHATSSAVSAHPQPYPHAPHHNHKPLHTFKTKHKSIRIQLFQFHLLKFLILRKTNISAVKVQIELDSFANNCHILLCVTTYQFTDISLVIDSPCVASLPSDPDYPPNNYHTCINMYGVQFNNC